MIDDKIPCQATIIRTGERVALVYSVRTDFYYLSSLNRGGRNTPYDKSELKDIVFPE